VILAISGSLRRGSINSATLRAAARAAARGGIAVTISDPCGSCPISTPISRPRHPSPCCSSGPPVPLRPVLLAVPEYAFGIPGAFKNALDWTVGGGSLFRKPVALLDVAPPGRGA
jgi:chromate reductase, NAD(P)H dehydrogenase (quinone)